MCDLNDILLNLVQVGLGKPRSKIVQTRVTLGSPVLSTQPCPWFTLLLNYVILSVYIHKNSMQILIR